MGSLTPALALAGAEVIVLNAYVLLAGADFGGGVWDLLGIVLSGSAFIFRSYGGDHGPNQRRWGRLFTTASLVTLLLLRINVGTIAVGRVRMPTGGGFRADHIALGSGIVVFVAAMATLGLAWRDVLLPFPSLYYLFRVLKSRTH